MRHTVLFTLVLPAASGAAPAGDVDCTWEKEIYVPMRDGVRLSTDVLLPTAGDGPFPTVLIRTPYHKDNVHLALDQRDIEVREDVLLFERNLNTGGNGHEETEWQVATNRIHHSATHPSHVVLPLLRR